jgi:hypothetical protein
MALKKMMIFLTSLLLAQSLLHSHTASGQKSAPTPAPSPEVRITIVNATSVPAISLSNQGTNTPVSYPNFPQGTWTANEPLSTTNADYLVRTLTGMIVGEHRFTFKPVSSQTLLITGDLSSTGPAESLPQIAPPPLPTATPFQANLQFHLYPCSTSTNDLCSYRVVNAMPSKLLILHTVSEGTKPPEQLALLAPGNSAVFIKQPPSIRWVAEIDGQSYPVEIEQEGNRKNCIIPFYLCNGIPTMIRVFEGD